MKFRITFHTPFRVACGIAGRGADSTVDRELVLPASSLKGVMRSAARDLLGVSELWIGRVYGRSQQPSPWSWSDAEVVAISEPTRQRARVQVAHDTSTVVEGALAVAEELHAERAEFSVEATGRIVPATRDQHEAVLVASARSVTAVGGDRRRGLGWVSVTPIDPEWPSDPDALAEHVTKVSESLLALRSPE